MIRERVTEAFRKRFGAPPAVIVRAPGRVNLIGEHLDYNDGFVLPMAIDRAAWIALRPRKDGRVVARSLDFNDETEFSVDAVASKEGRDQRSRLQRGWVEYLAGVAWALQEAGHKLDGWEGVVAGDVPVAAGLSSSASLEMATARAFATLSGIEWNPVAMAKVCQRAENEWIGVNCGIMDMLISAAGREGSALLIDCRSLEMQPVPLPKGTVVIVLDTTKSRALAGSAYNERRAQCEAAAKCFSVPSLRDVSREQFDAGSTGLDEVIRRRARHVITENARTLDAAEAMRRGDAARFGELMNESHASLRDDYEVSSRELNAIVDCARAVEGCLGARMTGAGFGGCAIAFAKEEVATRLVERVREGYRRETGLNANLYVCRAVNGAEVAQRAA